MASAASKRGPRQAAPAGRNVLERLLVECVQPTRAVPAESGVRFHVNVPSDAKDSVCLIFHVDLPRDPLVTKGPRPDYLVLYGTRDGVILTIVEMKGKGEQDLTHGVDQISTFAQLLREQLKEHAPAKLKPVVQGVLLMAHGAHAPSKKLGEMNRQGLVIAPVSYHHSAELFPYVSQRLRLEGLAYRHESIRPRPFSALEHVLAEGRLSERVDDGFLRERHLPGRPGIYVNYRLPGAATRKHAGVGHAALAADPVRADIGVCPPSDALHELLVEALEGGLGLRRERKFLRVLGIPLGSRI